MNKILARANRRATVGGAAVLISGAYLASRLLGLLRDRLLAAHFGISPLTDAYTAAFRLPELLFTLLVSGAFAVAFIPVITAHWSRQERDEAWEVSSVILNLLMLATLVLGVVMFILADPLTTLIAPGFDAYRHQLTVELTRIMLVTPFFFAISSVFGSIQQSFNRFFFYATASIFYNLGIIFGIVVLADRYGIYGVAIGVVAGTAVQAAVQILGLAGLGYRYRPSLNYRHKSVIKILKLMVPRSIDQGINQLNYTVQTIIGSQLAVGSLTAYYYANNLKNVPLAIFGSAIATAAFPGLAKSATAKHRDSLIENLVTNARLILFLVIPSATVAVLMRGYIVRLLFGFGSPVTASLLGWFAGVIVFQSLFFLIARVYYALQDTKTPLYTSLVAIGLNIFLSVVLVRPYGVVGLAMAQSLAAAVQTAMLAYLLKQRLGTIGGRAIARNVAKMLLANLIMASVIYLMVARVLPLFIFDRGFAVIGPKFAVIALAGALAYLLPSYALGLREARLVVGKLKASLLRPLNLD
ncbi:MAG TPA: murein biosynthesis integral membrane protein MurJ [Candidatus Saccharimonadales bacterium]|nr:murein biosynthesis integral membrane protein MurJ [Candidatus Saccharimonadales bacterium]